MIQMIVLEVLVNEQSLFRDYAHFMSAIMSSITKQNNWDNLLYVAAWQLCLTVFVCVCVQARSSLLLTILQQLLLLHYIYW